MSVQQTIDMINQACTELVEHYRTLAERALTSMNSMTTMMGCVAQYQYRYTRLSSTVHVSTSDTPWPWWKKVLNLEWLEDIVPHPDRDQALARAEALFGDINANDEQFGATIDDIVETPLRIARLLSAWLNIRSRFAAEIAVGIPSNPVYVPTSGDLEGWLSPAASTAYEAIFASQDRAADRTHDVMTGLLTNAAAFLESLQSSLAGFATLTGSLNDYYARIASMAMGAAGLGSISMPSIAGLIDDGVAILEEQKKIQVEAADTFGTMINDTIGSLLDLDTLENQITLLGESSGDDGWPSPIAISTATQEGSPSRGQLVANAQYFVDHARFWDQVSQRLDVLFRMGDGVAELPVMFTRIPTFSADQSVALNQLSTRLTARAMGKGRDATQQLADKLTNAMRSYLAVEAENTAEAEAIEREVSGG